MKFSFGDADGKEGLTVIGVDTYSESDYNGCGSAPCEKQLTLVTGVGVDRGAVVPSATDATGNTSEYSAAPRLEASKEAFSSGGGPLQGGSVLTYRVTVSHRGHEPLAGVVLNDLPDASTSLVSGSASFSGAQGSFDYTGGVLTATGDEPLPAGASIEIEFDVVLLDQLPLGVEVICNQGSVSAATVLATPTDDPSTSAELDPTCNDVEPNLLPTVVSVQSIAASGGGAFALSGSFRTAITQIYLTFSKSVSGAGTLDAFRLIDDGDDGVLSTPSCAAGLGG